jgi:hypothetical protein
LTCKSNIHSVNCPSYNSLKGASAVANNNQQPNKQLMFHQNEINIIQKVLEISRYYITKNKNQFQNPNDILKEINQSMQILKPVNSLKGASSICPKQTLRNIKNMFGLT